MRQSIYKDTLRKSSLEQNPYDPISLANPKLKELRALLHSEEGDGIELQKFRLERELLERFQNFNFSFSMDVKMKKLSKFNKKLIHFLIKPSAILLKKMVVYAEKGVLIFQKAFKKAIIALKKADAFVEKKVMRFLKPLEKLKVIFQVMQRWTHLAKAKLQEVKIPFKLPTVRFSVPKFHFPKITFPKFSIALPKFNIKLPKITFKFPSINFSHFSFPKILLPKVALPKIAFNWPKKWPQWLPKKLNLKRPLEILLRPLNHVIKKGKKVQESALTALKGVQSAIQPPLENISLQLINLFIPLQSTFIFIKERSHRFFKKNRKKYEQKKQKFLNKVNRVLKKLSQAGVHLMNRLLRRLSLILNQAKKVALLVLSYLRFVFVILKMLSMIILYLLKQMIFDAKHYFTTYLLRR